MKRFLAWAPNDQGQCRLAIAVDLGHSGERPSCGVASDPSDGQKQFSCMFNALSDAVVDILKRSGAGGRIVLLVEAPMSLRYADGLPACRGEFESGRGWWCNAGAATLLGAMEFLRVLDKRMGADSALKGKRLWLAEAFVSRKGQRFKRGAASHVKDAKAALAAFKRGRGAPFPPCLDGTRPTMPHLIQGRMIPVYGPSSR